MACSAVTMPDSLGVRLSRRVVATGPTLEPRPIDGPPTDEGSGNVLVLSAVTPVSGFEEDGVSTEREPSVIYPSVGIGCTNAAVILLKPTVTVPYLRSY